MLQPQCDSHHVIAKFMDLEVRTVIEKLNRRNLLYSDILHFCHSCLLEKTVLRRTALQKSPRINTFDRTFFDDIDKISFRSNDATYHHSAKRRHSLTQQTASQVTPGLDAHTR